jgi:asparagine synthase (glutamine-hydrolysing)
MCGLAGILSFAPDRHPVDEALLLDMREAVAHRGPDGAGLWIAEDRRIGLAHRRLSIIDLSLAALQPMASLDGRYRIIYNGEVYNHREIRRELEALGHTRWQTDHSDTEVILNAFAQWGIECLQRFRGMFAFALWDVEARALWLVRDRIGIKPLYYAVDSRGVAFASEIKALLRDPRRERAVDEEAFFHFLSFLTAPAPMTLFKGIRKLPAAHWLRIGADGSMREARWWDPLDAAPEIPETSDGAIADRLLALLRESVAYHKVADVPQGVFLSGGIDSSTNLRLFSEGENGPARSFAIGYQGDHRSVADELPYARLMAESVGADHHELRLAEQDLLRFLPRMVELQDEPIADPVCVPVHFVSKLARDNGVIACQVGEGADELFWGYPGWRTIERLERFNALPVPAGLKRMGVGLLEGVGHGLRTYTELLRRAAAGQSIFWGGAEAFGETMKRRLLSSRLKRRFQDLSSWDALAPLYGRFREHAREPSILNWMTYLDLNLRLPELLLMRVDKMSMAVGLEARVPYLDHELVAFALAVPGAVKTRGGELKYLLKRAVSSLLPEAILKRPKQGFGVPVREWFYGKLGQETRATLDRFCRDTDFLDRDAVATLLGEGRGAQSWYLLNFALWWEAYVAG